MIRVTVTPTKDFEPVNNQGSLILARFWPFFLYDFLQILDDRVLYILTPTQLSTFRDPPVQKSHWVIYLVSLNQNSQTLKII